MYATIIRSAFSQAQGRVVETFEDGRIAISVGDLIISGWPVKKSEDPVRRASHFSTANENSTAVTMLR